MAGVPFVLPFSDCHDVRTAGGKALNLGKLLNAGFSVPDGFAVTTEAFRAALKDGVLTMPAEVASAISESYRAMGSPVVAVRSSATAEDMAEASMAGQYETFLDVSGADAVLAAVQRCWASLDTPRTRAYLTEHGIPLADVAMAVAVQRLVSAEIAGVLFTANPRGGSRAEMVLDASYGLGESVVSGVIQPDTVVIDRATGAVRQLTIGSKETMIQAGTPDPLPVPTPLREKACLDAWQVRDLWKLGLRVVEYFGSAQDLEWAIAGGKLYLLQSRAITTLEDAEAYEQCLQSTRAQLRAAKRDGRGDWVRHNIAETLPHPTPLTWSVIRRFMSGDGGFGAMYRLVGFEPSTEVRRDGFLDLIAGRIYMDLARGPGMFFEKFPFRYDLDLLRANPDAAQGAPTIPSGSATQRMGVAGKLNGTTARLRELAQDFDTRLEKEIMPAFVAYVRTEKMRDLRALTTAEWLALWQERSARVMDEFAPQSLLPSLISSMVLEDLRAFCAEHFWDEDAAALANILASGADPDRTVLAAEGLHRIAAGEGSIADWLEKFGHRAPEEFDLATPRWRERPDALETMAAHMRGSTSPLALHHKRAEESQARGEALRAQLSPGERAELDQRVQAVRRYLHYREDGKFFLMLGYDLLRDLALEAGRRLRIDEDVFLLRYEQLHDALATGFAPLHAIEAARSARAAETRVTTPHVITEQEIETLGEPVALEGGDRLTAFSISSGVCTGPVRIVFSPTEAGEMGRGYVLVCPSTDPNWTPLFAHAAGLVIERGGTLSHGAVVAREMGLPAVVLDGATKLFADGEIISIDSNRGAIFRGAVTANQAAEPVGDANDIRLPAALIPPPPGARERSSARLRNIFLALWGVYFLAAFLLPAPWVYDPSMRLLDAMLWPLVAYFGKPAAVAIIAVALAAFSMIGQRVLTDNRRLLIAKERAAHLSLEAAKLPKDSPRARTMRALAAPVQTRVMLASFVPLAVILGPMVMSFSWLPARVDPASWNAAPGATVFVTATVDGDYTGPVTLTADPALSLGADSEPVQSNPPIRATLETLRAKWQAPSGPVPNLSWELRAAASKARQELLADLTAYLKEKIPAREVAWTLSTPAQPGRYRVSIATDKSPALVTHVVLGDRSPPEPHEDLGDTKGPVQVARPADAKSPLQLVRLVYKEQLTQSGKTFWQPFERLGWHWSAGWLLTYIAVYLPLMFLFRRLLRIP